MYSVDKLKKLRKERNISVKEIATMLGITIAYYSLLENKKRRLYYDMAFKIARIFDMIPDELFID